jgi:hypothetical protein
LPDHAADVFARDANRNIEFSVRPTNGDRRTHEQMRRKTSVRRFIARRVTDDFGGHAITADELDVR